MLKTNKMAELLERKNPPFLTLTSRNGTLSVPDLRRITGELFVGIPEMKRTVIMGLLFLWHDHWNEAHAATHEDEGHTDSDLLHALVHRREGDYGNSGYWLREVGEHPLFEILGPIVEPLLVQEEPLFRIIIPNGKWNPKGFGAAVKAQPDNAILREVQAEEFCCFYRWLLSAQMEPLQ